LKNALQALFKRFAPHERTNLRRLGPRYLIGALDRVRTSEATGFVPVASRAQRVAKRLLPRSDVEERRWA